MARDTRIAYGAMCFWWGPIQSVGTLAVPETMQINGRTVKTGGGGGLPCCPVCRGMLLEVPDEATFIARAQKWEDDGHPGYVVFIQWSKGKCFKSLTAAQSAYAAEGR